MRKNHLFSFVVPALLTLLVTLVLPSQICLAAGGECEEPLGDINGDNIVDVNDLAIIHDNWLVSPCDESNQYCDGADLDDSNNVDFLDYALFAQDWLVVGNCSPVVDAGEDQTITYHYPDPTSAVLDGTVTDDGLPAPPAAVTTLWTQESGPGAVVFDDVNAVDTTATFPDTGGTYVLRLTADDGAASSYDEVTITVIGKPLWSETANYYVDGRTGDDTNPGSSSLPYKTIGKAVSVANAGKKVLVWGDQTYAEALTFGTSGTAANPITFRRDPASGEAIIDASDTVVSVVYSIRAYNVIDGFTLTKGLHGVYLLNDIADGWVIKNCRIRGNSRHGIYVRDGDNATIHNNAIYLNSTTYAGIYVYDSATNATITQCVVYKNKYGIQTQSASTITTVRDCIITKNATNGLKNDTGCTISPITYCDVWSNGVDYSGCSAGTGCISSDPKFVDPDNGDFHLGTGSPCKNKASDGKDMGYRYGDTAI